MKLSNISTIDYSPRVVTTIVSRIKMWQRYSFVWRTLPLPSVLSWNEGSPLSRRGPVEWRWGRRTSAAPQDRGPGGAAGEKTSLRLLVAAEAEHAARLAEEGRGQGEKSEERLVVWSVFDVAVQFVSHCCVTDEFKKEKTSVIEEIEQLKKQERQYLMTIKEKVQAKMVGNRGGGFDCGFYCGSHVHFYSCCRKRERDRKWKGRGGNEAFKISKSCKTKIPIKLVWTVRNAARTVRSSLFQKRKNKKRMHWVSIIIKTNAFGICFIL